MTRRPVLPVPPRTRIVDDPPWALRIVDDAPLALVTTLHGEAWMLRDGDEQVRLQVGDVAIVRGPAHYTVADDPATSPSLLIHPGGRCSTPEGVDQAEALRLAPRTWGRTQDGATILVSGTYQLRGEVTDRLLNALPHVLVVPQASRGRRRRHPRGTGRRATRSSARPCA